MDVEAHFEEVSIAIQLPYNHQIRQSKRSQILGYLKVLDFVGKYVASLILETWLGRSDLSYEQCEILVTWKVDESRFSNIQFAGTENHKTSKITNQPRGRYQSKV